VVPLLGAKTANGKRRFKRCLMTSGKKSLGKTALAGALSVFALCADGVQASQVLLSAVTRKQANNLYNFAFFAVKNSEFLSEKIKVYESTQELKYEKKFGKLTTISGEAPGMGGWSANLTVYDEVALPATLDARIRSLGNAIVPQVAAAILRKAME
jgi:phage terminase large subunit-like protein